MGIVPHEVFLFVLKGLDCISLFLWKKKKSQGEEKNEQIKRG